MIEVSIGGRATIYDAKYITENFIKILIPIWKEVCDRLKKECQFDETVEKTIIKEFKDLLDKKIKEADSFKLKTEKLEKVVSKVRAFAHKLLIDEPLKPFFLSTLEIEIDKKLFFVRRGVF